MAPPTDATAGTGAVPRSVGHRRPVGAGLWSPVMGQPASRPRADRAQPLLGAAARLRGGDDEQLVAVPQHGVVGAGTNALAVAHDQRDVGPGGQPQLEHSHAVQPRRPARLSTCEQRRRRARRAGSTRRRGRRWWAGSASPSRRATQGRVGACTRVKMTTSTKTRSKSHAAPGVPTVTRHGGEHDRHGAAQPGPGQEGLVAPRHPGTAAATTSTDSGRASSSSDEPDDERRHELRRGSSAGVASSPSSTNSPIWASQPSAVGEAAARPAGAAAAGCRARAPRGSAARKPEVCSGGGGGVREHGERDDADGEQGRTTRRPRSRSSRRARPADAPARRRRRRPARATAMRPSCHQRVRPSRRAPSCAASATTRMHDGRVVEARLGLEHPGEPPGQRHPAQHGEHRGGVGRGEHGADEQRDRPRHAAAGSAPPRRRRAPTPRPRRSRARRPARPSPDARPRVVRPPSARMSTRAA